jgi:hypothetical protein
MELEPKDLRIENLVSDHRGNIIVVESINDEGINLIAGDGPGIYPTYEFNELKPIPIKNHLLNLGFTYHENYGYTANNDILNLASFEYLEKKEICFLDFEGTKTGNDIKFIHEYQNHYEILTGENLKINLCDLKL